MPVAAPHAIENIVKSSKARRIMNFAPKMSLNLAYMTRKPDNMSRLYGNEDGVV